MQGQPDRTEEPADLPEAFKVNGKGLPGKVFRFRQTLYLKAKREPAFRFYTLYDRICQRDVLQAAWEQVAANDGAPGVDGVSIAKLQSSDHGVSEFLDEIQRSLRNRTYQPQAVKRVYSVPTGNRQGSRGIPIF